MSGAFQSDVVQSSQGMSDETQSLGLFNHTLTSTSTWICSWVIDVTINNIWPSCSNVVILKKKKKIVRPPLLPAGIQMFQPWCSMEKVFLPLIWPFSPSSNSLWLPPEFMSFILVSNTPTWLPFTVPGPAKSRYRDERGGQGKRKGGERKTTNTSPTPILCSTYLVLPFLINHSTFLLKSYSLSPTIS